jgi:hypothetical protein
MMNDSFDGGHMGGGGGWNETMYGEQGGGGVGDANVCYIIQVLYF